MEELLTQYSLDSIILVAIFIGMLFDTFINIANSLINYLCEKAWRCKDYEKAFYELYRYNPYILNAPCHKTPDFKYVLLGAVRRHEKRLNKKNKFKNSFKKKKN